MKLYLELNARDTDMINVMTRGTIIQDNYDLRSVVASDIFWGETLDKHISGILEDGGIVELEITGVKRV